MARFKLVDGDVTILTRAFNALRGGIGTYFAPTATLDGFLEAWKGSTSAFASEAGFIAISIDGHPKGAATVVLCQYELGAVDAHLGDQFRALSRELLKGFGLQVIRAATATVPSDRLLTLAGFSLDGKLRKLVPDETGALSDLAMYSLTVEDLIEAEPANFVYAGNGADVPRETSQQDSLPLGV